MSELNPRSIPEAEVNLGVSQGVGARENLEAEASLKVSEEDAAIRARREKAAIGGEVWGQPASVALDISQEIKKGEESIWRERLGIDQVRARLRGIQEAHPRVIDLALKIVGRLGDKLAEKGEAMVRSSKVRAEAALRHIEAAVKARESLIRANQSERLGMIASVVREAVPQELAEYIVALSGRREGRIERLKRWIKERYHSILANYDARQAEINAILGRYYTFAGQELSRVSQEILTRWPTEKEERKEAVQREGVAREERLDVLRRRMEELTKEFEEVVRQGPSVARGGGVEIERTPAGDIKSQEEIVRRTRKTIADIGTSNTDIGTSNNS